MKKAFIAGGLIAVSISATALDLPSAVELEKLSRKDAMIPVAPGKIGGGAPFWNIYARRFIYVPSFDFKSFKNAKSYRFTVIDAENKIHTFTAARPDEPLTAVWNDLPVGFTTVSVDALDANGNVADNSGVRKFYRAAPFTGNYPPALRDYRESARWALKYVFEQKHIQDWLKTGKPSTSYKLYCYPSKIIGSVIRGMIAYAKLSEKDSENALAIARKCADYLISISEKAGTPLEYMPPTYMWKVHSSAEYAGQNMMIYPANVGEAYLLLYDMVKDKKYLDAARRIADTYCKLQLPNGSWYLKLNQKDGSVVMGKKANGEIADEPNYCMPSNIAIFLAKIGGVLNEEKYMIAAKHAEEYMTKIVLPSFNWEGQFEDQAPRPAYVNNTEHSAVRYAQYLLSQKECSPKEIDTVRTLLRYSEDQFVVWEKPMPRYPIFMSHSSDWLLPCVLEQYEYYVPIDASAAAMLKFYMAMHRKTGDVLDLAKAKALADAITRGQDQESGRYLTYWENNDRGKVAGWINCAMETAYRLMEFSDYLDSLKKK